MDLQYVLKEIYCCFNHEYRDGKCVVCERGYVSRRGKPCVICDDGKYGCSCSMKCTCNKHQICNHKKGCVLENTTYYNNTENTSTGFIDSSSPQDTLLANHTHTPTKNRQLTSIHYVDGGSLNIEKGQSILIVYIVIVAAIMIILGLLYPLVKYVRAIRSNVKAEKNIDIMERIGDNELEPSVYDEIDDEYFELK